MTEATTIVPEQPERERKPRTAKRGGWWVNDAELIERMGVPEKVAREALEALDKDPKCTGFPQKQPLWGNKRYLKAVKDYFEHVYGFKMGVHSQRSETHD